MFFSIFLTSDSKERKREKEAMKLSTFLPFFVAHTKTLPRLLHEEIHHIHVSIPSVTIDMQSFIHTYHPYTQIRTYTFLEPYLPPLVVIHSHIYVFILTHAFLRISMHALPRRRDTWKLSIET